MFYFHSHVAPSGVGNFRPITHTSLCGHRQPVEGLASLNPSEVHTTGDHTTAKHNPFQLNYIAVGAVSGGINHHVATLNGQHTRHPVIIFLGCWSNVVRVFER